MRVKQFFGIIISSLFIVLIVLIYKNRTTTTTVLIQAGHEGRKVGNTGSINGNIKEVDWNIILADRIAKNLEKKGINFTRVGADIPYTNAKIAISIHFDGSNKKCSTGASIGYENYHHQAEKTAQHWKKIYQNYFPFKWHRDNYTKNLSNYYGFSKVNSEKGFLVLELGEITCNRQVKWLKPKLNDIADMISEFIMKELNG